MSRADLEVERPLGEKDPDPNRARRAAASQEKTLETGGERVFVMLPKKSATIFRRYMKRFGGKKAALEALIDYAQKSKF